jgi:sialate O-acetylesterase
VPVWGKAAPGEKVTVTLDHATAATAAGADGRWKVVLDLKAEGQGPHNLVVQGNNTITVPDVVIGEAWLCAGQENMGFQLKDATGGAEEIAQTAKMQLRQFTVERRTSPTPADDVAGTWAPASPKTSASFSAVSFFFGKRLYEELNRPIGLIVANWGGTPIETWLSPQAIGANAELTATRERLLKEYNEFTGYQEKHKAWMEANHRTVFPVPDSSAAYVNPDVSTAGWKSVRIPNLFADVGLPDAGAVWLRKKITLPPDLVGMPLSIGVGDFRDSTTVYFNGVKLGQKDLGEGKGTWFYTSAAMAKSADVVITMRIQNCDFGMGVLQGAGNAALTVQNGRVKLDGDWLAKVEYELPTLSSEARAACPVRPVPIQPQIMPSFPYNGMIAPLIPYAIAGTILYHGEANVGTAWQYRTDFPLLIGDWRKQWGRGDFPFYYCQYQGICPRKPKPSDSAWAEVREAQTMALALPNTAQAVLIDIGDEDKYPPNRKDMGERLSLVALARTYGKQVVCSGPTYASMSIEADKVRIRFTNADGGLVARPLPATYVPRLSLPSNVVPLVRNSPGSPLEGFAICGADRQWVWANATIDGNDVIVSAPSVAKPIAVRYAWASNPICNLGNGAGLPAGPFRTDSFPMLSEKYRYPFVGGHMW